MTENRSAGKIPLHPLPFALIPLLFLYAHNIGLVNKEDLLVPAVLAIAGTAIAWLLLRAVCENWTKAAVVASAAVLLFFSYGPLGQLLLSPLPPFRPLYEHLLKISLLFLLPLLLLCLLLRRAGSLSRLTGFLNAVSLIWLFPLAATLILHSSEPVIPAEAARAAPRSAAVPGNQPRNPNIYYIILDGYGRADTLETHYGFPNRRFLEFLRKKGFYVAENSRSNYPDTLLSLASSLNMDYIHDSKTPYRTLIKKNQVAWFLRSKGYRHVHIGSGWFSPTVRNRLADINLKGPRISEYAMTLVNLTPLEPVLKVWLADLIRKNILFAFDALLRTTRMEGPLFVFAHILSPHPPFVFTKDGAPVPGAKILWQGPAWHRKSLYTGEMRFLNKKIREVVETLLQQDPKPVILLQGDHGPAHFWRGSWQDQGVPDDRRVALRERFGNLSAYYLPGTPAPELYPSITPVNSFRIIFNRYFGADYPLLPDRSYASDDSNNVVDVTEELPE